jgi:serine/threonine protein kinase
MEYIEGLSFKDYLESRGGRIPFEEALNLLFPVMQSLDIVHHEGMLHRDIAPDNIYITRGGQTKLLDFGAARFHQQDDTHSIRPIIKPGYAPMEQYTSTSAQGPWTDVYAIGATFYRAITGIVPPDAPTRAMHDEIRSPSQLGVQLPAEADSAIMRALAPNIVFRFRSVTDFCRNLIQSETASTQNTAKSNPPLPPTVLSEHPTQWLNPAGKQPEPVTRVILIQPPFQSDVKNLEHTGFFRKAINRLSKFISDNVSLSWILIIGILMIVLILLTVLWIKP